MDKKQQISNLLGIAKRAGKINSGEELVIKSIQSSKATLVFLANDAAANLSKRITDKSNYYEIAVSTLFTEIELSHAIGQNRKVIALVDDGFAKKMESLMNN
ncbi:YlxQ-related RNA-binding protein [Lactococcus lactis subsp. lactis]|uniref:YlxQ-related RNA-binding protein n=1 Tax=Lactococcus lactis TaxID=1358 RepID=A0AAW7J1R7_9LACT|nr:YlxQ-related RNA-binding protein [Lactococcus lactis]MCT0060183.1 YlxQ-related RNA-binding protein [Lactococcus lactis subsp. lactis]MCT0136077.1 YlxQ-related RNA-binding protein [Lactococcus lactis subsp. lactis]MDM7545533.1 YlxQ-related RNA-binding protein [Lactococcus lactis]